MSLYALRNIDLTAVLRPVQRCVLPLPPLDCSDPDLTFTPFPCPAPRLFPFATLPLRGYPHLVPPQAVAAKLTSTHFYRTAHFKKFKRALEKEYYLQVGTVPVCLSPQLPAGGDSAWVS